MAAPLAQFDEDWQDFYEFKAPGQPTACSLDHVNSNAALGSSTGPTGPQEPPLGLEDFSDLDNSFSAGEIGSFQSMEDLVSGFDEKLTVCFRNYNTATEGIAPVRPITEETAMKEDEIWNALTDNYGNVMPVDWKTSHTRTLHLPMLNLSEKGVNNNLNLDLSDDEELREQLDMHSIIVSCLNDEPLFTADQVIEEIEEMMQESPDPEEDETPSDRLCILSPEVQTLKRSSANKSYEERVKRLSVAELNELLEEIETTIKDYSEELVQQLALRDELEYEKEVKNSFISVLIEVQNKQKEHKESAKKKKKLKNASPVNGRQERSHMPGTAEGFRLLMETPEVLNHGSLLSETRDLKIHGEEKERAFKVFRSPDSYFESLCPKQTTPPAQNAPGLVIRHEPERFSMEGLSNVIQNGFRHTFGSSGGEKQYLTTVIPYEKKNGPPSVEDLQILTKILHAMKEDSEKVPTLLTDYILKVLCPT